MSCLCTLLCIVSTLSPRSVHFFFFFNDTATTEIYTLSLHDALPISARGRGRRSRAPTPRRETASVPQASAPRSEEHTSELQSRLHLVCRLLLEKKKKHIIRLHLPRDTSDVEAP